MPEPTQDPTPASTPIAPLVARAGVIASMELMVAGAAFGMWSDVTAGWQAAARYSGRLSLAIFALILIAQVHPRSLPARLLGARPYHLLAWNHVIHLGFLLTYLRLADRFPPAPRLAGGMVGYAVIVLMPFVHELRLYERLREVVWQRWIRTHAVIVSAIMAATFAHARPPHRVARCSVGVVPVAHRRRMAPHKGSRLDGADGTIGAQTITTRVQSFPLTTPTSVD